LVFVHVHWTVSKVPEQMTDRAAANDLEGLQGRGPGRESVLVSRMGFFSFRHHFEEASASQAEMETTPAGHFER
jgi:hypothetical protein